MTMQDEVLEDLGTATHYIDWLASLCDPWLGERPIEIGAGRGDYAQRWRRPGRTIVVSEADPGRLGALGQRFDDVGDVQARLLSAPVTERSDYTAAVALNVLEHIEDDVDALRSFAGLVRPGGHVIVIVPAFQFAFSRFDRQIGHYRRYRTGVLRQRMTAAGLEPAELRYVNSVGLIGWTLLVRLLHGRPRDGVALRLFDRLLVPALRWLEARRPPPFGQSVLGVARVPEAS